MRRPQRQRQLHIGLATVLRRHSKAREALKSAAGEFRKCIGGSSPIKLEHRASVQQGDCWESSNPKPACDLGRLGHVETANFYPIVGKVAGETLNDRSNTLAVCAPRCHEKNLL